jgi:hypothetical protein
MSPFRRAFGSPHVLLFSSDVRLVADVEMVCAERGIVTSRLDTLGALPNVLARESAAGVLLLDAEASLEEALRAASTLKAVHPRLAIVIAVDAPKARSEGGFRLVDRWRAGERLVDELELAHIGIPAFVFNPMHDLDAAEHVQGP